MGGVVKGFQIDCNLAGPLGDLTGRGDQSSGKVGHKDRNGPLGDLTGIILTIIILSYGLTCSNCSLKSLRVTGRVTLML